MKELACIWKSETNSGDIVKNIVISHNFISNASVFISDILTEHPQNYYEYKIIKQFKNKFLIRKEVLLLDKTWCTIAESIRRIKNN